MPFAVQVSRQPSLLGRRVPLLPQFAICILQFAFCIHLAVAADARYVAVLSDGSRVEGREIRNWGNSHENPQLDGTELLSPSRPFRWLRDLAPAADEPRREANGLVELIGGDRFLGRVLGFVPGGADDKPAAPPHLLVALEGPLLCAGSPLTAEAGGGRRAEVRVLPQFVRRIVWGKGRSRDIAPGMLLFRDGGRLACQSLRWQADGVRVLTADGIRQVPLAELSEVCLPQADAWQSYCEELAALDPECKSRLVRLETTRGCILSTSLARLEATGGWDRTAWCHVVRPAWCLDALCVPFSTIQAWWTFTPHEVPLSRWPPVRFVSRPMLGKGWSWQVDRNVEGGLLASAKQVHGWGFGVHAPCELWFEIPPAARGFQVRVGLDRLAGSGGCARALVCLDRPDAAPRFRSKHLIGSSEVVDAGTLALDKRDARRLLILVADAADRDRPPGADPLDIRDMLDWIEPLWLLDPAELRGEVQKRVPAAARPSGPPP
jgi:hypothetical protein